MHIPAVDPNTLIVVTLVVGGLYGLAVGKHRLKLLILSVYVGIVLAEQLGTLLAKQLSFLNIDQIHWLLLGLPILLFGFAKQHHGRTHVDRGAMIGNVLVGILAGALIISSAIHLMSASELASFDNSSFLAYVLEQYHLWLLGLLPLVAVIFGLMKGEKRH